MARQPRRSGKTDSDQAQTVSQSAAADSTAQPDAAPTRGRRPRGRPPSALAAGDKVKRPRAAGGRRKRDDAEIPAGAAQARAEGASTASAGRAVAIPSATFTDHAYEEHLRAQGDCVVAVNIPIDAILQDGIVAFNMAAHRLHGSTMPLPVAAASASERPPMAMSLEVGRQAYGTFLLGPMKLPGIEGYLTAGIELSPEAKVGRFVILGQVKVRDLAKVERLAAETRTILKTDPAFLGRALATEVNAEGAITGMSFLDLSAAQPNELVLSDAVQQQLQASLWAPIEKSGECRELGIPLKRGILLTGRSGTGKSTVALATARRCVENGWSFLMVSKPAALERALLIAENFLQPCVVFAEDVGRGFSHGAHSYTDSWLTAINGAGSKSREVITLFAAASPDNLSGAMLRPGCIDAVIDMELPGAEGVLAMIRLYGRGMVREDDSFSLSTAALAGHPPAVIRECVERSKLAALARPAGRARTLITDKEIAAVAKILVAHAASEPKPPGLEPSQEGFSDVELEQLRRTVESVVVEQATKVTRGQAAAQSRPEVVG